MLSRIFSRPELSLFALAFFVSNWDLLLAQKLGGFTFKLYQPLFLACAAVTAGRLYREKRLQLYFEPLRRPFVLAIFAFVLFSLALAPWSAFPLKSVLYSAWLLFDILVIWLATQRLFRVAPVEFFVGVGLAQMLFNSVIILIDFAAYPFGYKGGFIGHNQDIMLGIGVSRPHSFSYEPSYAAVVLCLGLLSFGPHLLLRARQRLWVIPALLTIFLALVATTSRTGWASFLLGGALLLALALARGKRPPWRLLLAGGSAAAALVLVLIFATPAGPRQRLNDLLVTKIFQGNDSSGVSRLKAIQLAYTYARDTHWLGTGFGASYRYYKDHGGFDYNFKETFNARMNGNEVIMSTWGQLLGEGGPLAVLFYALAGISLLSPLYRSWRAGGSRLAYGSFAAGTVYFLFDAIWLGNVCRGDIWVWFAVWGGIGERATQAPEG